MEARPFSKFSFIFCCLFILGAAFTYPKWQVEKAGGTLTWDVMGYYLYLPAFLIYGDAKSLSFKDEILKKYAPTGSFYQAFKDEKSGNMVMKYPIGLSILYLPFFLLGHLLALIGGWPADGFSLPYQLAISFGSMLVAFVGLWFLRKSLLYYFDDKVVAVVLIAIALGTNYYNYSAFDYAMPHNYLFTLCALLLYFFIRFYQNPAVKNASIIGVCVGLAALARPTDVVFAIIPLLFAFSTVSEKIQFLKKHFLKILLAGVITLAIGCIQLIYWKWVSGSWIVYSYQDQGFNWKGPHFHAVWFSYRKGWFVYTPMMLFAVAGMFFLFLKKYRPLFWPTLALFFVHMWIVAAWNIWWYGGGFGQRAMIDIYPVLALPMAAFLASVWRFSFLKILFMPVALFFIALNIFQTRQSGFETEEMTRAYYWRIFGNTEVKPRDRYLLDTDEDFSGERKNVKIIFETDFENWPDSTALRGNFAHSGRFSTFVNPQKENFLNPGLIFSDSMYG